jgi:hypothetical protein
MKELNIEKTGMKIDVAAIEWPANATMLEFEAQGLVCRTTDTDEYKEGEFPHHHVYTYSQMTIKCGWRQVIGTSSAWRVVKYTRREDE